MKGGQWQNIRFGWNTVVINFERWKEALQISKYAMRKHISQKLTNNIYNNNMGIQSVELESSRDRRDWEQRGAEPNKQKGPSFVFVSFFLSFVWVNFLFFFFPSFETDDRAMRELCVTRNQKKPGGKKQTSFLRFKGKTHPTKQISFFLDPYLSGLL